MNILLGVCGSISAYKAPWLVRELQRLGAHVRVVMTPGAANFVTPLALQNVSRWPVILDPFEPNQQQDGSWHVHLAHWAHMALVAPCSANTLSKLAQGLADTALSLVLLSLPRATPVRLAPAMDPDLWSHPATQRNVQVLRQDGVSIMDPQMGEMASGLVGIGRLAEPHDLAHWALGKPSLQGCRVMITAGPTRESIDAVRYISNHSSGKMGYALAQEALRRGAEVVLISGPTHLPAPAGVELVPVESAAQMLNACQSRFSECQILIKAAAVADFSPSAPSDQKLKKDQLGQLWSLELQPTVDILAWLGQHKKPEQLLVGFALETNNAQENARLKLKQKGCDLIVLNLANQPMSGFAGDFNTVELISPGSSLALKPMPKADCAHSIWDHLETLRS